jgi:RHS repeat-associated protein
VTVARARTTSTVKTQTQNSGTAPANDLKFAGEQHDPTGLIHLRARQHDPATGRFLGRDPLDETPAGSAASPYAYVHQRPTVLIDPSGLEGLATAPGHAAARMPVSAQTDTGDQTAPTCQRSRSDHLVSGIGLSVSSVVVAGVGVLLMAGTYQSVLVAGGWEAAVGGTHLALGGGMFVGGLAGAAWSARWALEGCRE